MAQIHEAINKAMKAIDHIGKDRRNEKQGYKFRGIDDIYNTAHSVFADAGIFTTSEILEVKHSERESKSGGVMIWASLTIRYTFHGLDGSFVTTDVLGEGMDSGDKASNKAMAVGHKYAILQLLMIPTEEMKDPENESPEIKPKTDAKPSQSPLQTVAEAFDVDPFQIALDEATEEVKRIVGKPGESTAFSQMEKDGLQLMAIRKDAVAKKDPALLSFMVERAKAFARSRVSDQAHNVKIITDINKLKTLDELRAFEVSLV